MLISSLCVGLKESISDFVREEDLDIKTFRPFNDMSELVIVMHCALSAIRG